MRLKNKKNDIKKLSLIVLCFILVLTTIFYFMKSDLFIVKKIEILSENLSCVQNSQIKSTIDFFKENIFFLDFKKGEDLLKSKYLCIKSVNFSRIWPDKLELKISKREAKLILTPLKSKEATDSVMEQLTNKPSSMSAEMLDNSQEKFMVDQEGVVFDKDGEMNLAKVYLASPDLSLGKKLDDSLINDLLRIIDKLKTFGIKSDDMVVDKENLVLINSLPRIVFRISNDIDNQLAALQLILNKARIDDDKLEFIDLRFDKPVIRYGKGQSNLRN